MSATGPGHTVRRPSQLRWEERRISTRPRAPRGDAPDSDISHAAMLPLLIGGNDGEAIEEAEELPAAEASPDTAEDPRERPQSAA